MSKAELKDRIYLLTNNKSPLSYTIQSKSTKRKALLYFDESINENRAIRYAKNQKSPFEDEQDGYVVVEPITFIDGALIVPKNNPALHRFLDIHPGLGHEFIEKDDKKTAIEEIDKIGLALEAQMLIKQADIKTLEPIGKILLGAVKVSKLESSELRRDLLIFAANEPKKILDTVNDPQIAVKRIVEDAFHNNLVSFRPKERAIYFNLPNNKKKITTVPFEHDYKDVFLSWLLTDDGIDFYKYLEKNL